MRTLKLAALLAIAAVLAGGCGTTAADARGGTVNATLTDMKIAVDRTSVSAGPVTFVVKNSGAVAHELVVIKTDLPQDKLPADPSKPGKVEETGNVGESHTMAPGASKTFTVTLAAGQYALICNEVGHYAAGMHMAFTVK